MSTELVERLRADVRAHEITGNGEMRRVQTVREAANHIEALEQAVDAFADICDELGCERDNEAGLQAAAALTAKVALLTEALRPFARYCDELNGFLDNHDQPLPDGDGPGWVYVTIGDFRAARRALSEPDKDAT